jgi:hypothetical protein
MKKLLNILTLILLFAISLSGQEIQSGLIPAGVIPDTVFVEQDSIIEGDRWIRLRVIGQTRSGDEYNVLKAWGQADKLANQAFVGANNAYNAIGNAMRVLIKENELNKFAKIHSDIHEAITGDPYNKAAKDDYMPGLKGIWKVVADSTYFMLVDANGSAVEIDGPDTQAEVTGGKTGNWTPRRAEFLRVRNLFASAEDFTFDQAVANEAGLIKRIRYKNLDKSITLVYLQDKQVIQQ